MPDFPHMKETEFPNLENVNVYKYENEFDYSRYDYTQMKLCLCRVPWDMGEAHIGNRTISGIGNVVHFGTPERRDSWFASIPDSECVRIETKFKELHRNNEIIVPIPFDVACRYNYLTVEYSLFANDESLVEYENGTGVRHWYWFIREVEFVAPNATRLHLLNDAWQTFIYDVDIPYMLLERGHAPMFEMSVEEYLNDPVANSEYLLEPDSVLENANERLASANDVIFDDGEMYAVFVTSASVSGNWGTNNSNSWKVPASARYHTDGNLSYSHIAVDTDELYDFLTDVETQHPQFKQTVQAVYLISAKLVAITATISFAGHSVYLINCTRKNEQLLTLDMGSFGFNAKYARIAKLYTYPYSWIELTDENGNVETVKIEDTTGTLNVEYCFNTAFPALNLNAHVLGVSSGSNRTIDFKNVGTRHFRIGGKWYDIQYDWAIPTFGVILEAAKEYDYSGYFDRQQAVVDYTATYSNAVANANATYSNATASNATAKTNTTTATTAQTNIATRQNRLRSRSNQLSQTFIGEQYQNNVDKIESDRDADISYTLAATSQTIEGTAAAAMSNAVTGLAADIGMGAISGGPPGAAIGAAGGAIQAISGAVSTSIIISKDQNMATISRNNIWEKSGNATTQMRLNTVAQTTYANGILTANNNANNAITEYSVNSQNTIATATKNTADANALRSRNVVHNPDNNTGTADRTRSAAIDRVSNMTRSEGMRAPYIFGSFANGENANVKPKMLSANVVTQGKAGIRFAGDEFLRYGYRLNRQYEFDGNWCRGKHFTYWKLSDFWVKGLSIPDMYMDKLRFFLFGGVTVWDTPEAIGHVSIYDNWA